MPPKNSSKYLKSKILRCLKEAAEQLEQDDIEKIANSSQFKKFLTRIQRPSAEKLERILRRAQNSGAGTKEHPIPSNSGSGCKRPFGSGSGSSVLGPHGGPDASWEGPRQRGFNSDSESEADENKDPDEMTPAELELAITGGSAPKILVQQCQQFVPMGQYHLNIGPKMNEVFDIFTQLEFDSTKELLLETLLNRLQVPAQTVDPLPHTWEMTQPQEIFLALQTIETLTEDTKIHRAFGQIQFYECVKRKAAAVSQGSKGSRVCHKYSDKDILKSTVDAAYNGVSPKEIRRHLDKSTLEYNAGLRWIDIAKSFGGTGAIIIFVLASTLISPSLAAKYIEQDVKANYDMLDVSMYNISKKWKPFQVNSLKFIAQRVPSIRKLAQSMGDNALEDYCRHGKLSEEIVGRVVEVQGLPPPPKRSGRGKKRMRMWTRIQMIRERSN
ncbi:MAG: hypothetical protein Q9214_002611 [Letrouitia sp. 1 TL-2023]